MGLADRVGALARRNTAVETRSWADQWLTDYLMPAVEQFGFGGSGYRLNTSYGNIKIHEVAATLPGYVAALRWCPPAFAAQLVRALVLSQARFTFRNRLTSRTPRRVFGTTALGVLEKPWTNATTGELLARMEWHAGLAGNAYVTNRSPGRLRVLRPDWVAIVYGSDQDPDQAAYALDGEVIGYVYAIGGLADSGAALVPTGGGRMYTLLPDEVAHWSPIPDPEASGIGMSWITPAVRDIQADRAATDHKIRFFAQGATPNLVVKGLQAASREKFLEIVDMLEERHAGVANAYKTLYLTEGADATVIGSNFRDMDLKNIQGASETRISSLSRVPASLLGIAEGLAGSSLNAGNFGMARRIFADTWVYPTLQDVSAALAPLVRVPSDAELWFDVVDMPLLREDGKDAADIEQIKATTITQYVREGFTAESAIAAVRGQDVSLLVHTGLVSVQLQPPGTVAPNPGGAGPSGKGQPPFGGTRDSDPDDWDDDGEWDEDVEALVAAMAEFAGEDAEAGERSAWTAAQAAQHPRNPAGSAGGGRFRSTVDKLIAALAHHHNSGGKGDPFAGFNREQLRKAALKRGITLSPRESRDSIAAKLVADLSKAKSANAPNAQAAAAATPTVTPARPWGNGDMFVEVHVGNDKLGIVVHSSKTGGYYPFTDAGAKATPLGNTVVIRPGVNNGYQTERSAVDAIVQAHTPQRVSGPGLAGHKLTELRIHSGKGMFGPARSSHEIQSNGTSIGRVDDWGYGWTATDQSGSTVWSAQHGHSYPNKSAAIAALLAQSGVPAPAPAPAKPPVSLPQGGTHGPEIQGALDILYGKDPKGHTIARQLEVYGSLRRSHFSQLGVAEQQGVLADLAYIETNTKAAASAIKASKLIDRFTPPGTPVGTVPTPSAQIVGPASGKQTRLPSPQTGLLKQATNSGARGDNWIGHGTKGGAVWGEYGAGGLLLRHVDSQGVERFLLTQRGPGISDPGKWSYPGGAFESREDFYQGATREFAEELGFSDADFAGSTVHGYHVFERPDVTTKTGKAWTYHSVAADVPKQLKPNLSTSGALAETSDAKWMTRDEIAKLDKAGKLHKPVAGGKLQANVMSLFPSAQGQKVTVGRPGLVHTRPARLTGTPTVNPPTVKTHKRSTGTNLIADQAARDKLRQDVKNARRQYAGKSADDRLAAIGAMQGFDDTPTVVTKAEFDDLLASGEYIQVWRGVKGAGSGYSGPTRGGQVSSSKTAAQIHEEFRSGPAYYGVGIYGNGYYFSTSKSIADGYSDGRKGSLLTALIPKKAKIVEHKTIEREAQASGQPYSKAKGKSHEKATLWDEGRFAAAKGHDMIRIPPGHSSTATGKPNYVVLNRSVMIVLEEQ